MTSKHETLEDLSPTEDLNQAALAAALPHKQDPQAVTELFSSVYRYLNNHDEMHPDDLVGSVESFFWNAVEETESPNSRDDPFVADPKMLAVVATLAVAAVTNHEKIEGTPPERLKLFADIRNLYSNTLTSQFTAHDEIEEIDLAELIYQKDSVHPGRTCTSIVRAEEDDPIPAGNYLQIPLVAASQKCMVREEDGTLGGGYDPRQNEATGELKSEILRNHVYVPGHDLFRRMHNQLEERGFKRLYDVHMEFISDANLRKFLAQEEAITDRIDRFLRAGQRDLVWKNWDPDARLVRVLRSAVKEQDDLDAGEAYPAKVLYQAMERYQPDGEWEETILRSISNQSSLANRLTEVEGEKVDIIETKEWESNLYRVGYSGRHSRQIQFDDKEDLFELPCMQNIDERLKEQSPTRKDLYNMVRMLRWLPGYRQDSMSRDEFVEEVKELFERRYPWYDEQTSDYQIRYELDQRNDDDDPYLPMGCKNTDMERYCIGRDECPYSIYGSLPFPDEMYDQLQKLQQRQS
jgi:hypothetical protein